MTHVPHVKPNGRSREGRGPSARAARAAREAQRPLEGVTAARGKGGGPPHVPHVPHVKGVTVGNPPSPLLLSVTNSLSLGHLYDHPTQSGIPHVPHVPPVRMEGARNPRSPLSLRARPDANETRSWADADAIGARST